MRQNGLSGHLRVSSGAANVRPDIPDQAHTHRLEPCSKRHRANGTCKRARPELEKAWVMHALLPLCDGTAAGTSPQSTPNTCQRAVQSSADHVARAQALRGSKPWPRTLQRGAVQSLNSTVTSGRNSLVHWDVTKHHTQVYRCHLCNGRKRRGSAAVTSPAGEKAQLRAVTDEQMS